MDTTLANRDFKKGENLFEEGCSGCDAYLITRGQVAIWRLQEGTRVNLAIRNEGDIVGEMALLDDTVRSATATAETDVQVDVITRPVLQFLMAKVPEPLETIMRQFMETIRCSNDLIGMYASRPPTSSSGTADAQTP